MPLNSWFSRGIHGNFHISLGEGLVKSRIHSPTKILMLKEMVKRFVSDIEFLFDVLWSNQVKLSHDLGRHARRYWCPSTLLLLFFFLIGDSWDSESSQGRMRSPQVQWVVGPGAIIGTQFVAGRYDQPCLLEQHAKFASAPWFFGGFTLQIGTGPTLINMFVFTAAVPSSLQMGDT